MNQRKISIGSRRSKLAVIQAEKVTDYIDQANSWIKTEIVTMETTGDRRLDVTLDKIGGKGLFVKELDKALLAGKIDLAVHSLKDMPMEENVCLPIVAYSPREDERDVLVLRRGVTEWNGQGVIGCSSFRRKIQGARLFPKAEFRNVRGNVLTRLKKLDEGEYDALILAAAGLKRLGLEERIVRYFSPEEILPAAGQGILAVQGRAGVDYGFLEGFEPPEMHAVAKAERAYVRFLDGGCTSPVAAHAKVQGGKLSLRGLYFIEETGEFEIGELVGEMDQAEETGIRLAKELKKKYGEK